METGFTKPQKTLLICAAFIAGAGFYLQGFNIYILAVFIASAVFLAAKKLVSFRFLVLYVLFFCLSILYADFRKLQPDVLYEKAPTKIELTGRVLSEPRPDMENKTKFFFKTDKGKTLVYIYDFERKFEKIKPGDILKLTGSVKRPHKATNPGQFDYEKYLNNKGVFTLTHVSYKNWEITGTPKSGIWYLGRKLSEIREKIISTHAQNLKSPKLEVLGGMVFGDYAVPAPHEIEENFIKSGLLHLLAASGLNVGIIFGIWYFLASRAGLPFRPNIITGMLLVAVYALMTGLPPSVTRAALMMELLLFGKLLDRKADNTGILVIVCALMLLFNPLMLKEIGFQLSFVVTLGLLLYARYFNFWTGIFLVPLVAQLFAAPLQVFHFNTFALYSVLANMAVMPFVSVISFAGFTGSILSLLPLIGEKLCFVADKIAEPFIFLLLFVSEFTAELPNSLQYLARPEVPVIMALYAFFIVIVFSRKAAIIPVIFLVIFLFKGSFSDRLEIMVFDVGQGDATLISAPDNRHILVDTGPPGRYSPARTSIVPYLRDRGINRLDALVLSHPDSDHIGGAVDILKAVRVKNIYHNGIEDDTKIYNKIKTYLLENKQKTVTITNVTTVFDENNFKVMAIRPANINTGSDNEDSIMIYVNYKDFSALIMADCEADSLNKISEAVKKPVDLLRIGHHGSEGAVSEELLKYINPTVSVISVGTKGYQWGHPHPETISLLEGHNSKIYRTDMNYALNVVSDGVNTEYRPFKSEL